MSLFSQPNQPYTTNLNSQRLFGYRIQTSLFGTVIPLCYGTDRLPGNVIWAGNWTATSASGGKLKGGKAGSNQAYDYTASIIIGLCHGVIQAVSTIWVNKIKYVVNTSTESFTIPSGGGPVTLSQSSNFLNANGASIQVAYSYTVNDYGSPGNSTYTGNSQNPLVRVSGSPTAGEYYVNTTPGPGYGQVYFAASSAGQLATIAYQFIDPNTSYDGNPTKNLNFGLFTGVQGQAAASLAPAGQQLGYTEIAYMASESLALGESGSIQDFSFETHGEYAFGGGILDADYPDFVTDFLSDPLHGVGFPGGAVGDFIQPNYNISGFINIGSNIWTVALATNPATVTINGTLGTLVGSQSACTVPGDYFWGTGTLSVYSTTTPVVSFTITGAGNGVGIYCGANGIFISPTLTDQRTAASVLQDWAEIGNYEYVWSEGLLKFRPYGDKTAVGGGVAYIPNNQPVYDLDDDDYLSEPGEAPVKYDHKNAKDCFNSIRIEWTNRGNEYQSEPVEQSALWHINQFGFRPGPSKRYDAIKNQIVAVQVANIALKNSIYKLNTWNFKISGLKYMLLEPMDLVTLTDENLFLTKYPVRILKIEEDASFVMSITAEDFPWGTATPTLFNKQTVGPFGPGFFANPGSVYVPVFFEPTLAFSQFELIIGLTGNANWGGCTVWASLDGGVTYNVIGRQQGPTTMGILTGSLPYSVDPDTTDTLSVNISQSNSAVLPTVTKAQADALQSLFVVDYEMMSYENSTLSGANTYGLTYLRRGAYNSVPAKHASNASFMMCDGTAFKWNFTQAQAATTVYFKFTSFNQAGNLEENIANVTAYPYYVRGGFGPYVWTPYDPNTAVATNELYKTPNFGLVFGSLIGVANSSQQQYVISGYSIINQFSQTTNPPAVVLTTVATGGTIAGGQTVYVGVYAQGQDSLYTPMKIAQITIPSGTNTNTLTVTVTFVDPAHDSGIVVCSTSPDFGWFGTSTIAVSSTSVTLTTLPTIYVSVPDPQFDHYEINVFAGYKTGVGGYTVATIIGATPSTGQCTITFTINGTGWNVNAFANRTMYVLGKFDPTQTLPIADVEIISNTTDSWVVNSDLTLLVDANSNPRPVVPGDLLAVRMQFTSGSSTSITDSLLDPATRGSDGETGMVPHAYQGAFFIVTHGIGLGQDLVTIQDNTADTLTLTGPCPTPPDTTTQFDIISSTWTSSETKTVKASNTNTPVQLFFDVPNPAPQNGWTVLFVEVITKDVNGNGVFGAFRELYVPTFGQYFVTSAVTLPSNATVVTADSSAGGYTITLPLALTVQHTITITKSSADTNVILLSPAVGDSYNGATVLVNQGDTITIIPGGN